MSKSPATLSSAANLRENTQPSRMMLRFLFVCFRVNFAVFQHLSRPDPYVIEVNTRFTEYCRPAIKMLEFRLFSFPLSLKIISDFGSIAKRLSLVVFNYL